VRVACDADDSPEPVPVRALDHLFSDRVLAWPELPRECLVDHHDSFVRLRVGRQEPAAGEYSDTERSEVIGSHELPRYPGSAVALRRRQVGAGELHDEQRLSLEWPAFDRRGRHHAGRRLDVLNELLRHGEDALIVRQIALRSGEGEDRQMLGAIAKIQRLEPRESANEQCRTAEHNECERHLRRDKPAPAPAPCATLNSRPRVRAQHRVRAHA